MNTLAVVFSGMLVIAPMLGTIPSYRLRRHALADLRSKYDKGYCELKDAQEIYSAAHDMHVGMFCLCATISIAIGVALVLWHTRGAWA